MFEVVKLGHPALRQKSELVDPEAIGTPEFKDLVKRMIQTMRKYNGVGIAAPQIGLPVQIFCVECRSNKRYKGIPDIPVYTVVNPKVTVIEKETAGIYEGCLSIPDLRGWVERPKVVRLEAITDKGKHISRIVKGFHARIIQHEYDHLMGKVYLDRVKDRESICYEEFLLDE